MLKKYLYRVEYILMVLLLLLLYVIPIDYIEGRSFCVFYTFLDIECCGCGLTRAFFNMSRLHIIEAIDYNWLILLFFPLIVYTYFRELCSLRGLLFLKTVEDSYIVSKYKKYLCVADGD